jgi:hypothetical protein
VTAYSDREQASAIPDVSVTVEVSGCTWLLKLPVAYIGKTVYLTVGAAGAQESYQPLRGTTMVDVPANGKTGIALIVPAVQR